MAVQPAGDHRQRHRLAGRVVDDARLAQRVRPADRADAYALCVGGGGRARDRDRDGSRARGESRAGQSDPRFEV